MYKINRFHLYVILAAAVFAEIVVVPYLRIGGAKPDIVIICVAFCGMFVGSYAGLEAGLLAGFLLDVFTLDIFWINTFIFGVAGFLAGELSLKFYKESRATQFFFVFGLTVFSMCLHYAISIVFMKSADLFFVTFFFVSVIPSGLYTAILAAPILKKLINTFNLRDYRDIFRGNIL